MQYFISCHIEMEPGLCRLVSYLVRVNTRDIGSIHYRSVSYLVRVDTWDIGSIHYPTSHTQYADCSWHDGKQIIWIMNGIFDAIIDD